MEFAISCRDLQSTAAEQFPARANKTVELACREEFGQDCTLSAKMVSHKVAPCKNFIQKSWKISLAETVARKEIFSQNTRKCIVFCKACNWRKWTEMENASGEKLCRYFFDKKVHQDLTFFSSQSLTFVFPYILPFSKDIEDNKIHWRSYFIFHVSLVKMLCFKYLYLCGFIFLFICIYGSPYFPTEL